MSKCKHAREKIVNELKSSLEEYFSFLTFSETTEPVYRDEVQAVRDFDLLLMLDPVKYNSMMGQRYEQTERMFNRAYEFLQTLINSAMIEMDYNFKFEHNVFFIYNRHDARQVVLRPAVKYDPRRYLKTKSDIYRAIQYYSYLDQKMVVDFHQLVETRIAERNEQTHGGFRYAFQYLHDHYFVGSNSNFSPFQIYSLLYHLPLTQLFLEKGGEKILEEKLHHAIQEILSGPNAKSELMYIDDIGFLGTERLTGVFESVA